MRKRKLGKYIAVALSTLLVSTVIVGCGSTPGTEAGFVENLKSYDFENPVNNTERVFRMTGTWPKPPLYQGNPYASDGVGAANVFIHERFFEVIRSTDRLVNRLAESYENVGNQTIIKIREGVTWHDGTPYTSKDAWAYYILNHNKVSVPKLLSSIETPDDHTIVFNWNEPAPFDELRIKYIAQDKQGEVPYALYKTFVDEIDNLYKTAPKATENTDKKKLGAFGIEVTDEIQAEFDRINGDLMKFNPETPIGTGPFKFESVTETDLKLTKNENHWDADNVNFDKVHIKQVAEESAKLAMLKSGAIDLYEGGLGIDIIDGMLNQNKDIINYKTLDPAGYGIILNTKAEPFDDVKVRQAVTYVLDREKVKNGAGTYGNAYNKYSSLGIVGNSVDRYVSEEAQAKMTDYSTNHEKAEKLLLEAGWTKGTDGVWMDENGNKPDITIGSLPEYVTPTQIIAEQLTAFGIPTKVLSQDSGIFYSARSKGEYQACTDFVDVTWSWMEPYFPLSTHWNNMKYNAHLPMDDKKNLDLQVEGIDGKKVNPDSLVKEYPYADEARRQEIIDNLVYIANENVYSITMYQPVYGGYINTSTIAGEFPMMDKLEDMGRNMMAPIDDLDTIAEICKFNIGAAGAQIAYSGQYGPR